MATTAAESAAAIDKAVAEKTAESPSLQANETELENSLADQLLALQIVTPLPIAPLGLAALKHELVGDLVKQIFEIPAVCFLTSFALSFQGRKLQDWEELSSIPGLTSGSEIQLIEAPYDPRSVRAHLRRLRAILAGPVPYEVSNSRTVCSEIGAATSTLHSLSTSGTSSSSSSAAPGSQKKSKAAAAPGSQKKSTVVTRSKTAAGRGKKAVDIVVEAASAASSSSGSATTVAADGSDVTVKRLGVNAKLSEFTPAVKHSKTLQCLREIILSGWNPVPGYRALRGDLLYLQATTCEGQTVHITASINGFFINSSTLSEFRPEAASPAHHSHHLVGLLSAISPTFKSHFQSVIEVHFESDPLAVLQAPFPPHAWTAPVRQQHYNLNRAEDALLLTIEGNSLELKSQLRDWNFDYQLLRDHVTTTVMDRLIRDCSLFKFNCDFVEDATRGVIDIISGSVPPLNPLDPRPAQMFLFDNIFFSFCMDARDLYTSAGGDFTAYKMTNNDVNGLHLFTLTNTKDLHTVPTAVIDYKGWRMIAQGVIPGILSADLPSNLVYGSTLPTDPLVAAPACSELMAKAAKALGLKEHSLTDQHGNTNRFSVSASTKGIVGTDGRIYVLDFFRMTPRDANFIGPQHVSKLLRFELLRMFRRVKQEDFLQQQQQERKKAKEQSSSSSSSEAASSTDSSADADAAMPDFSFNADCFTDLKLAGDLAEIGSDEAFVREASDFLVEKIIPSLFVEWNRFVNLPIDGSELCGYLHIMGVNLRYLGRLAKLCDPSHPIYSLLLQEMIARAAKHIFNKSLREEVSPSDVALATAFFINSLCGNHKGAAISSAVRRGGCSYDHAKLWTAIRQHVELHFDFALPATGDLRQSHPLALLRRFCLQTGVQVLTRDYNLSIPLPLGQDDILELRPRVKQIQPQSDDAAQLLAHGRKCFGTERLDHAYDLINEALRIYHQVYGVLHSDCGTAYSLLAKLLFAHGDFATATKTQRKATIIYERVLGLDDPETIRAYLQLGLYAGQTDPAQGLRYLHRARYLGELIAGEKYPDRSSTLTNIAILLQERGEVAESLRYLLEVLDFNLKTIGRDDHRTAANFHAIAMAYSSLHNYRKALEYEKSSHQIFVKTRGETHPSTIQSGINLKELAKAGVEAAATQAAAKIAPRPFATGTRTSLPQQLKKNRTEAARIAKDLPNARRNEKL